MQVRIRKKETPVLNRNERDSLKLHLIFLFPSRVLLQDDEALEHVRIGDILLRCQLRTLGRAYAHGRLVRLETRDCPRFASLTYDIKGLKNIQID